MNVDGALGAFLDRRRRNLPGTVRERCERRARHRRPDRLEHGARLATAAAHPGQSLLVLRVPESSVDQALAQITGAAGVGRSSAVGERARTSRGDLADLQSRVATQRASVERIRALMGKAGSLQDVVLLESEVTKREADLEALEARRPPSPTAPTSPP